MQTLHTDDLWMLRQLQHVGYESAIIAGGAVRDAYFSNAPHDIDIFIWDSYHSTEFHSLSFAGLDRQTLAQLFNLTNLSDEPTTADEFFGSMSPTDEVTFVGEGYTKDRAPHITGVWNIYHSLFETEYQIIMLNKPPIEYATKYFDIGLCMCYCDGTKMRFTNEFLTDANNHTLTICGDLTYDEYHHTLAHRVPKLQHRFKGYTVVDPLKDRVWDTDED